MGKQNIKNQTISCFLCGGDHETSKCPQQVDCGVPKLCPFCGAGASVIWEISNDFNTKYYAVQCNGPKRHRLDYWGSTPEDVINEWNDRSTQP